MLGWILDWIPLWVWIVAAVAALIVAQRMLGWKGMAAVGLAIVTLGAYRQGRQSGSAAARAKQAAKEKKARDIADQVDNDVGAMPPEKRREDLKKW